MTGIGPYEAYQSEAVERTEVNTSCKQTNCPHS
jgi:hypothetical protein